MVRASQSGLSDSLARAVADEAVGPVLEDGSRVAVVGGGPAGSLFAYFLLRMAGILDLRLDVTIYEPRSFDRCGPAGCNHCGGIVSEALVQLLATEGINLPDGVVQRGIDSYALHMDVGSVRIDTPLEEKRIAAVFRGNGPRDGDGLQFESFDRHLQELAVQRGARIERRLVTGIERDGSRSRLFHAEGSGEPFELVAVAAGINSRLLQTLGERVPGYRPPDGVSTYICEFELSREDVRRFLGTSMHVFLLANPRIKFAALIPKGNIVTLCMLGREIDTELVRSFVDLPEVRRCLPDSLRPLLRVCHCSPLINLGGVKRPYADGLVFLGDSAVTRLYKDGIGAAYRTAKAAAATAAYHGISARAFEQHYWPKCRGIRRDNSIGKLVFAINERLKKRRFTRRAILRMVSREQRAAGSARHMSQVLWDLFTGSAPYRSVALRTLHPGFILGLLSNLTVAVLPVGRTERGSHVAWRAGQGISGR